MRNYLLATILFPCFFFLSCFKLDNNLLSPGDPVMEYRLEDFTGQVDFRLDDSYAIPKNLIQVFSLQSKGNGETNNTEIFATYVGDQSRISTDTVILYCHGYNHPMDFYWERVKLLANVGGKNRFGVMMMDYRGFGLSKGEPTEEGLYADVNTCIEWLKSKGLTSDRLILYGFSLGAAPAIELTANPRSLSPAKLITESPFASAEALVQDGAILDMPASYVTSLKLNNAEKIKKVTQPFMWMHGTSDSFVGIEHHGEVVFKNYHGSNGVAHRIDGAEHGNIPLVWGFDNYSQALLDFITSN